MKNKNTILFVNRIVAKMMHQQLVNDSLQFFHLFFNLYLFQLKEN